MKNCLDSIINSLKKTINRVDPSIQNSDLRYLDIFSDEIDLGSIDFGNNGQAPFDFYHWLDWLSSVYIHRASEKNLTLHLNTGPDIPEYVVGEQIRLTQVMIILLEYGLSIIEKGDLSFTTLYHDGLFIFSISTLGKCSFNSSEKSENINLLFNEKGILDTKLKETFKRLSGEFSLKRDEGIGLVIIVKIPLKQTTKDLTPGDQLVSNWLKTHQNNPALVKIFVSIQ